MFSHVTNVANFAKNVAPTVKLGYQIYQSQPKLTPNLIARQPASKPVKSLISTQRNKPVDILGKIKKFTESPLETSNTSRANSLPSDPTTGQTGPFRLDYLNGQQLFKATAQPKSITDWLENINVFPARWIYKPNYKPKLDIELPDQEKTLPYL